jgi:hypothetical protein
MVIHIHDADLALALGALPIPVTPAGKPIALDPPRPTFIVQCLKTQQLFYWELQVGVREDMV